MAPRLISRCISNWFQVSEATMWQLASCYKLLGSQVLLEGSREIETLGTTLNWTCHSLECCSWQVMDHNPQSQFYTQWIPSLYQIFGPPKKYLAGKQLYQMMMWSMLSPHGYRHFIPVSLIPGCKHWYCSWICLNVSGDRVEVWCVWSATYVPCIFWHQNNFLSIIVLIQDLIQQTANP